MSTQEPKRDPHTTTSHRPNLVVDMLDRPVSDLANFCRQLVTTWVRGLIDPWKFGKSISENRESLAPPFAYLVTTLFSIGVTMKFFNAIRYMPISEEASIAEEIRFSIGELSLVHTILASLPCVLIVYATGWLLNLICRKRASNKPHKILHSTCYAIGWQFGCITLLMILVILLQMGGYEPNGALNDEMNLIMPYVTGFVLFWGTLILTPQILASLPPKRWLAPFALLLCGFLGTTTLVGSLFTLTKGTDLYASAKLRTQREFDKIIGDLQVNILTTEPIVNALSSAEGTEEQAPAKIVVAFTNRSKRVIVIPSQQVLSTHEEWTKLAGEHQLRILSSSLETLPDRALVIEPSQTRVATYVVETDESLPTKANRKGTHLPFGMAYFRGDPEGEFNAFQSVLWAPNLEKRLELADKSSDSKTKNGETLTR